MKETVLEKIQIYLMKDNPTLDGLDHKLLNDYL